MIVSYYHKLILENAIGKLDCIDALICRNRKILCINGKSHTK